MVVLREAPHSPAGEERPSVEYLLRLSSDEADSLPYGLIVLDRDGVVVGYNEAESRLSGYARDDVIGRNFFKHIAPCTRVQAFAGVYAQMVKTGEPPTAYFDFLFRFRHGDKRVCILLAYVPSIERGLILVDQDAAVV
jgi:photoactive yellow protein